MAGHPKLSVKDFEMALSNINAGLVMEDAEPKEGCTHWAVCEWILREQKKYIARVTVFTCLDWEGGLLIELEYITQFATKMLVEKERLEKMCNDVFMPIWNDASFVTSFIADRFMGFPLCMLPDIEIIEFLEAKESQLEQDNDSKRGD